MGWTNSGSKMVFVLAEALQGPNATANDVMADDTSAARVMIGSGTVTKALFSRLGSVTATGQRG